MDRGKRMGVWMEHGGGARLGLDGRGQGGWKMKGSETGCGSGVDRGVDGR